MATARETLSQIRQKSAKDTLSEIRKKEPKGAFMRMTRAIEELPGAKALGEAITGAGMGYEASIRKGLGSLAQMATGGRVGGELARSGEELEQRGKEIAPVSTFAGGLIAPAVGVTKATKALGLAKTGGPLIQRALRAAGIGAVTVPTVAPVEDAENMTIADFYKEKGGQALLGAVGGAALFGAGKFAGTAANRFMDLLGERTIKQTQDLLQRYKIQTIGDLEKAVKAEDEAARKAGAQQEKLRAQQEKIAAGQATREARAEKKAQVGVSKERQRVLDIAREREREAAGRVVSAETRQANARDAADQLERELLARPGLDRESFGKILRQTAKKLRDDAVGFRNKIDFEKVIDDAGKQPDIPTGTIIADIETLLKDVRYKPASDALRQLQKDLMTGQTKGLNLRAAHNLKEALDDRISDFFKSDSAADKRIGGALNKLKKALVKSATDKHTSYREALSQYRVLSRPLDIVERNGKLRPVLDVDPMSGATKLTESEVVGQVINKARTGNPTMRRLLETDPTLRDPARLYFTRDLLGTEGKAPTPDAFRNWLKNNEGVLRQTGLYDEFSSLARARQTAGKAVADAKSMVATGKELEAEAAKLRKAAVGYVERAAKTTTTPSEIVAPVTKRAEERIGELGKETKRLESVSAQAAERARTYQGLESELRTARPQNVPAIAERTINRMYKDGSINQEEYENLLAQLDRMRVAAQTGQRAAENLESLKRWTIGLLGLGGLGYVLGRDAEPPGAAR